MGDSLWAGGVWVCWGRENKETPLRQVDDAHWEYRAMDGTANMYLALAALLRAGWLGLEDGEGIEGEGMSGKSDTFLNEFLS